MVYALKKLWNRCFIRWTVVLFCSHKNKKITHKSTLKARPFYHGSIIIAYKAVKLLKKWKLSLAKLFQSTVWKSLFIFVLNAEIIIFKFLTIFIFLELWKSAIYWRADFCWPNVCYLSRRVPESDLSWLQTCFLWRMPCALVGSREDVPDVPFYRCRRS